MSDMDADVIIIGGGPAGVAAALELRRRGVARVMILERERHLGGATRHCSHSPFGMREFGRVYFGAAYGRRLEKEAAGAQIDVRLGHSVVALGDDEGSVAVVSHRRVVTLRAHRVLVATGAREMPRAARLVSGDRPVGVITTGTLQAYVAFHGLMPFRRPVIVGSELVSLSAALTCLSHGAPPVAMVEPGQHATARAPFCWFPPLAGIPFRRGADIIDIRGTSRVEAVTIGTPAGTETLSCDGVLFTGRFTPESALFLQSPIGVSPGSAGPAVDQYGRTDNPFYFATGNVLRAVETGGWAFREGMAVGAAIAADLNRRGKTGEAIVITFERPVKLVMPQLLRRGNLDAPAFSQFQLRFDRRSRGVLSLELDGRDVWRATGLWMPERRILVPIPADARNAQTIHFRFQEDK